MRQNRVILAHRGNPVQLATFSGFEQQVQRNQFLQGLATQLGTNCSAQMANLVGKEARANAAGYYDGDAITLAPNPVSIAATAEIVVRDNAGDEVDRFAVPVSAEPVAWNGPSDGTSLPHGLYSFKIVSYADEEALSQDPVDVYSTVTEVRSEGTESILILEGEAAISASQVSALRDPSI